MRVGGLGVEVAVVDFDIEIKVTLGGTRLHACTVAGGGGQRRGVRRDAPIIAIAIEQGLGAQRVDVQVAAVRRECLSVARIAEYALRLRRQRIGDGAGARQQ